LIVVAPCVAPGFRIGSVSNDELWVSLRGKGYDVGDVYVQAGVGPADGQIFVVISGVAMPFEDARALDRGIVTLDEIAQHRTAQ
jgi:hypothetical protein